MTGPDGRIDVSFGALRTNRHRLVCWNPDRKSTRLNSSHSQISYAVLCLEKNILQLHRWKLPHLRGTGIGMIFQEPINSLNPAYRIFDQVAEAVSVRQLREAGMTHSLYPV